MTAETETYLTLAHGVASHAAAGTLSEDTALRFCRAILPALLVELDIAKRIEARLGQVFPAPAVAPPQPPAKAKKKASRKAKKSTRRKERGHADLPS